MKPHLKLRQISKITRRALLRRLRKQKKKQTRPNYFGNTKLSTGSPTTVWRKGRKNTKRAFLKALKGTKIIFNINIYNLNTVIILFADCFE